jgi:signal peptidase II
VTKVLAVEKLQGRESIELIPNVLSLSFMRNGGAALGTGAGFTVVLTIVAIAVSVAVIRMAARLRDRGWAVGLGLLFAGAVGNLCDRLFREPAPLKGHVVDFIDYGVFVGNVADIALTFAAVVIVWRTWRGIGLDGSRQEKS